MLVLTDADIVVLTVRQNGEYRRVGTQQLKAVYATDHVNAVEDLIEVMPGRALTSSLIQRLLWAPLKPG